MLIAQVDQFIEYLCTLSYFSFFNSEDKRCLKYYFNFNPIVLSRWQRDKLYQMTDDNLNEIMQLVRPNSPLIQSTPNFTTNNSSSRRKSSFTGTSESSNDNPQLLINEWLRIMNVMNGCSDLNESIIDDDE